MTGPEPRAEALRRIDELESALAALTGEAARLRDEVAGLRDSVAAIEQSPPAPAPPEPAPAEPVAADDERLAGARLVALDLVLGGVPRDEAVLRMADEFPDLDVAALVDDAVDGHGGRRAGG